MHAAQTSQRFVGVTAALFFGSAAVTIAGCNAMSAMHDMPMCSGRTVPATMHDAAGFLVMWLAMMVAMMLPSLMPMLLRYRRAVDAATMAQLDTLTGVVGVGYFFVWTLFGVVAFVGETLLSDIQMRWAPTTGVFVLTAGVLQFSRWKSRHLACCRDVPMCCRALAADAASAWRHGLRLGMHCVHCCFGLTVMLLAIGMMDLCAMALVTLAMSVERLAPGGLHAARIIGGILVATGLFMIARATT